MHPMYSESFITAVSPNRYTLLPGVRQYHDGRYYREARDNMMPGKSVMIEYIPIVVNA